jgi:serine/threonine protein kinase
MTNMLSDRSSRIGEQVGGYSLVRFIGAGGMGEVYEARHATLGTRQAIKFLHRDLVRRPDLYARFEQEAQIAGTLENQHIVKVRDFRLTDDGMPYMVMDLAVGRSLAGVLAEQGRLELVRAVDLIHQACIGLGVAHAANIVHRDLKPENLYVCPQDDKTELLKILDFGIAKHLDAGESGPTTETGSNLGTAHYMSPEQAQGARRAIDRRTDIYALGVILYELLSGRRPHEGESYNEILIRIVTQKPPPLDTFCTNLPQELVEIVARAMARDPLARYQAAADFANALATLRINSGDRTEGEVSLQPSAAPRSSDLDTLASHPDGQSAEFASAVDSSTHPGAAARRASTEPKGKQPWWMSLTLQFCYALVVAAAITAAGLWLRGSSTVRQVSPVGYRAPSSATASALPEGRGNMSGGARATLADVATNHPKVSAKPSGRTSAPGRLAGQSRTSQKTPIEPMEQVHEKPIPLNASPTPKAPTIDEPLPPAPHAPGVPPVME